jgi:signal transduction histidine kinase/DNA-binding response OmpR family regulator
VAIKGAAGLNASNSINAGNGINAAGANAAANAALNATSAGRAPGAASGGARGEVTVVLAYSQGRDARLLVGTRDFHLYLQRGDTFEPFAIGARDPSMPDDELLRGAVLADGSFALATMRRGVLLVDREGRVQRQVDKASGLQENHVHAIWPDRDGGLWLATQNGISRVDVSSPFSIFDEDSGLEREWREVIKHQGTLYVRGYKGVFAADVTGPQAMRFHRVVEVEPPSWALAAAGSSVLAGSKDAIYELVSSGLVSKPASASTRASHTAPASRTAVVSSTPHVQARRIARTPSMALTMYRSRGEPARVYVGLVRGVMSVRLTDRGWIDEGRIEGIDDPITSIAEAKNGALWMVSQRQRVLRVEFDGAATSPRPRVSSFERGALSGRVMLRDIAGRPVFLTEDGIYELDAASETFVPSPDFSSLAQAGRRSFAWIAEDVRGDVWVASRKPGSVDILRRQLDGRYVADNASLLQMPAWTISPEPDGHIVWLSMPDYLLRYDTSVQTRATGFSTLLRKVVNDDTLVFGGTGGGRATFPYSSNAVRFEFAAPRFEQSDRSEFQSSLDGFDRHWSNWTREPGRSYTNLPAGDYRFRVRARDARGAIGQEATYAFTVLSPWYRSSFAYALYTFLVCGIVAAAWAWQTRRTQGRMLRDLEHLELEKLRELDRMKSRFFTDISHEFRTPLTLILGPITQMLQEPTTRDLRQRLLLVRRNAESLLRLISQLLDLSKVESGTMRLRAAEGDLLPVLKMIVASFATVAERQGIDLSYEAPAPDPASPAPARTTPSETVIYFDRDLLEKILNNLLANALKFTPHGGSVTVGVRSAGADVEIFVTDTGVGMSRQQLAQIFNRFYQGDTGRSREGIGIGLALVKELVELHCGTTTVWSEEGTGTTFVVRLPRGRDHLTSEEIVASSPIAPVADEVPIAELASLVDVNRADHADHAERGDDDPTVLIVEDHDDVRRFLAERLGRHYKVIEARDGEDGLAIAVTSLPDLVLSDVMMSPMDGYALCKALKTNEKTCHIPVVLLTARAGRDDKLQGLDIGADCYLVKPFDTSELLAQVRNLIDQRRMLRERFSAAVVLKPTEMAVTPMDQAFLARVLAVVEQSLSDPEFDIERLGREVGLGRSQLHRKLRALTNQPPTLLIRSIRLQRAAELLKQDAGSVSEVAYLVGFSSQAYFAKCFREQFGCAPKEYAKSAHLAQASISPPAV